MHGVQCQTCAITHPKHAQDAHKKKNIIILFDNSPHQEQHRDPP
jgi:hypothetical protein